MWNTVKAIVMTNSNKLNALLGLIAAVILTVLPRPAIAAEDVHAILSRQTQELCDAVSTGDAKVWDRYLAADVIYTDESGAVKNKAQLLDEIKPLPKQIWGKLKVINFAVHPHDDTAIATYVIDETEGYYGQVIQARYRETDTWRRTPAGWRLIAAQVLALRQDPPAVTLAAGRLNEYVGIYTLTPEVTYTIRREGDALIGQRSGRPAEPLKVEVADLFFVPGQPRLRKVFQRGPDGRLTGFVERRETWDIVWKRVP